MNNNQRAGNTTQWPVRPEVQQYREAMAELVASFEPTHFITLAFNRDSVSMAGARATIHRFHGFLDHACLGPKWQKKVQQRSSYVGVVEKPRTHFHVHLAVKVAPGVRVSADEVACLWKKLVPSGSVDVQAVKDGYGLGRYIAKDIVPETSERIFVSPWPETIEPRSIS